MNASPLTPDATLVRWTTGVALVAAMLVASTVLLAFYSFGHRFQVGQMEAQAALQAHEISQIVSRSPALWRFETERLSDVLSLPFRVSHGEVRSVVDDAGVVVADHRVADDPLHAPVVRRHAAVFDSGVEVGQVVVERCLDRLLLWTLVVAAGSFLVASAAFVTLRNLPLRALRDALTRASYFASHDPLTELPNRALFADRLQQGLAHADRYDERLALICLDLDHFKEINDAHGHAEGDALLRETARRLSAVLRKSDTVARLGGDEFAIVQFGLAQPRGAELAARRISAAIAEPFELAGNQVTISTSLGIALYPEDGGDPATLQRNADTALYRAKADGRGVHRFFEEQMNVELNARRSLERDLRRALAEDAFTVHYQPQYDLLTAKLTGVEALLRWDHPARGMVSPAEFVPIAEETGLVHELGEWVLRTACREALAWPDIKVAVNLSPVQFRQAGLADRVARVLREVGLPPRCLELEITEGVLLQNTEATIATLHVLKILGVKIALDDFGTGYSSLSYLRRFSFDKIKVDRSFVGELGRAPEGDAIVRHFDSRPQPAHAGQRRGCGDRGAGGLASWRGM
ncbi:MAG: EAL domain-containing protein [Pseudomonadota bacterium]